ncbi:hypothetical protein BSL78_27401 [Apostichopus japonicus]|uniref:DUF7153 domain-containing protein n=1 Tax=Stichopus japonicus TaxID=307972 RepID=A0A2G8JJ42_STIJA|nr:hypothetical protein BSL78_27401 [Apostichopus japonicus]
MEELHVVCNFYEKITPPPKFKTFIDGWKHLGEFVEKLDYYVGAVLHENLDPKGMFPYMNFATFKGTEESVILQLTNPSQELIQALVEGHGLPGHQINHPGGYNEVATDNQMPIAPDIPTRTDSIFFVSCFQATEGTANSDIEQNWTRYVGYDTLKSFVEGQGKSLGRAGFYKRFTPVSPFGTFSHVFRCELVGFHGSEDTLWEVVRAINGTSNGSSLGKVNSSLYKVVYVSTPRNNNK